MTIDTPSDNNPPSPSTSEEDRDTAAAAQKQWQEQETFLEEALEESFPASDPIPAGHLPPPIPPKPKP
jgi:hypothetical protein